jgi:hypothetical protein
VTRDIFGNSTMMIHYDMLEGAYIVANSVLLELF